MPKAISLFAGAGGCSLGFRQAGYEIIYASDINSDAIATYRRNFPHIPSVAEDITQMAFEPLLEKLALKAGQLDIMIGGPPCQGFSSAGSGFWDDPRNALLKPYLRALEVMKPKWFFMENVEGLLTANKGQYLFEMTKRLIDLGYKLRVDKIYATEYGIPQRRKRVLIIGNRLGRHFEVPRRQEYATGAIYRKGSLTLQDAISGLPLPTKREESGKPVRYEQPATSEWEKKMRTSQGAVFDHVMPKLTPVQQERMKVLKPGQSMKDLPEHLQHASFKRRANRRVRDGTPTEKRGGAPSGLKRLFSDEPSLTITSVSTRDLVHPTQDRPLTIRECARLQTFPDEFQFSGNSWQKMKQIGNAIPPLLAQTFAKHIMSYGFDCASQASGELIGFSLTKASAMSPALKRTHLQLCRLMPKLAYTQAALF